MANERLRDALSRSGFICGQVADLLGVDRRRWSDG
jgi:hypothetical protein